MKLGESGERVTIYSGMLLIIATVSGGERLDQSSLKSPWNLSLAEEKPATLHTTSYDQSLKSGKDVPTKAILNFARR